MRLDASRLEDLNGVLQGRAVYVLGSGDSLLGFDTSVLDGKPTIAVNALIQYLQPSVHFWLDEPARDQLEGFLEDTLLLAPRSAMPTNGYSRALEIRFVGGINDKFEDGLFAGGYSGLIALNIALLMEPTTIYLLGYDFKDKSGQLIHEPAIDLINELMSFGWPSDVVNLNPDSALDLFPKEAPPWHGS